MTAGVGTDATAAATCPSCGAAVAPGDRFCESCGGVLVDGALVDGSAAGPAEQAASADGADAAGPAGTAEASDTAGHRAVAPGGPPVSLPPCAACGGEVDENRWCTVCGLRAPSPRDHWTEQPAAWVAATCDRGKRHARNEDAMAVAADAEPGSFCALVVCDGVTTAAASDEASLAACAAALDTLLAGRDDADDGSPAASVVRWSECVEEASRAANAAATAVAATVAADAEPPSCTFVAAVLDGPFAVAGWVGDSRAYWLPDDGAPVQLTVDDSWATEQIALGVPRASAEADPRAHSITRWLGADSGDAVARCASVPVDGAGWLLACSDGLWNHCSAATDLRTLLGELVDAHGDDPAKLTDALVAFANDRGGHDNITVALARVPARAVADPPTDRT
jgi:serine/threonine protein phosphatase PrpC